MSKKKSSFSFSTYQSAYEEWARSPLGVELWHAERQAVSDHLQKAFGYHLMQIGIHPALNLLDLSPIRHKFMLSPTPNQVPGESILCSETHVLPLASAAIDVVVLHHALDFTQEPHQIVREASRVLIQGGKLIIVGFNPWSSWGARKFLSYLNPMTQLNVPWSAQFIPPKRIQDWLTLLEFQALDVKYIGFKPPFGGANFLKKLSFMESWGHRWGQPFGCTYVILAQKREVGATPIRPNWNYKTADIIPIGLARPSTTFQPEALKSPKS